MPEIVNRATSVINPSTHVSVVARAATVSDAVIVRNETEDTAEAAIGAAATYGKNRSRVERAYPAVAAVGVLDIYKYRYLRANASVVNCLCIYDSAGRLKFKMET